MSYFYIFSRITSKHILVSDPYLFRDDVEVFNLKVRKIICVFLLLFVVSFIQRPCAEILEYNELRELLLKRIPKDVKAKEFCLNRSYILLHYIISELGGTISDDESVCEDKEFDQKKSFALKIFIEKVCQLGQPPCDFVESSIIAGSSDLLELRINLQNMEEVYRFLSDSVVQ